MKTHTWIEQYRKTNPRASEVMAENVAQYVQFDCGDADDIPITKDINDFLSARAPYQKTLLQFDTPKRKEHSCVLVLWTDMEDGRAMLAGAFRFRADNHWKTMAPYHVIRTPDGFRYEKKSLDDGRSMQEVAASLDAAICLHAMAMNLFSVLGCSNVATVNHDPTTALNKKRARTGKCPLFSYKTLVVVMDKQRSSRPPMGGTHSSPRVHLRRGHIRRINLERKVWVQSCVVGSNHGIIFKDYRLTTKPAYV